jgi:precorrin-8X/cobalt-precorrin-8 methylmutase
MTRAVHPIERESYRILRERLDLSHLPPLSQAVTERIIHASADLEYAETLVLDERALDAGRTALRAGAPLIVDVRMVAAGITSREAICLLGGRDAPPPATDPRTIGRSDTAAAPDLAVGAVAAPAIGAGPAAPGRDADAAAPAIGTGALTRSAAAVRRAARDVGAGAVWAIGNAPTALLELLSLAERGALAPPALVIGLPVGFVGAAESKAALAASGLPCLTNRGEKGGSAVASAAVNALIYEETP